LPKFDKHRRTNTNAISTTSAFHFYMVLVKDHCIVGAF
jgi:hypothetical protein